MNNRDKEIRKLMAEKGFDSFDDLSERLNQFPTTDSYEDVVAELAELKMQLINPQPLFILTPEEIMEVKCAITNRIHNLKIMSEYSSNSVFLLEGIKICENLLKRLNDYGKEV